MSSLRSMPQELVEAAVLVISHDQKTAEANTSLEFASSRLMNDLKSKYRG